MTSLRAERALILAPLGRDAPLAGAMLLEAGIEADICPTLAAFIQSLEDEAGFAIVTEEALAGADTAPLLAWRDRQPAWSDFPFILLTARGGLERNPAAARYLELLGNVTFVERPFHPTTMISLAKAALRGRRKQYEARARLEELAESEARYRTLFDSMDEGFCVIEFFDGPHGPLSDYIHVEANAAYERHAGIDHVVGQKLREMVGDEADGWVKMYRDVLVTGQSIRFERELVATGRHLELSAFRIEPESRQQVAVLFQDISARKTAENALRDLNETLEQRVDDTVAERNLAQDALRQAQKMEAIGQLTGGVAHDFNNMLTIIRSSADLLGRPSLTPEKQRRFLDAIIDTSERAAKLTKQLLAFSRQQPLNPEVFDASERVRGIEEMLKTLVGERIAVGVVVPLKPLAVLADIAQFETAIVNLAVNARDAMDGQGSLELELFAESGLVCLSVTDSGTGIAPDNLSRIFDPFFTTKDIGKGTGLGLSQVYGFAKQSGGDVRVKSEVGSGTTFTLLLPYSSEMPAAKTDAVPASSQRHGGRILVVEDNDDVRDFTNEVLQDLGFQVDLVCGGAEALEALNSGEIFDLVFTDVMMENMDGVALAREIRRRKPRLPVVLASGYSEALSQDMQHGFPFLPKPYSVDDLTRIIESAMAEKAD